MENVILSLSLLLSVVCVTHGRSTTGYNSGCVYSFKVPTSDCAQTPSPSVDDQIWKSSVIALQTQFKQMANELRDVRAHNVKLSNDMGVLETKLATVTAGKDIILHNNDIYTNRYSFYAFVYNYIAGIAKTLRDKHRHRI